MKSPLNLLSFVVISVVALTIIHKAEARVTGTVKYIELKDPPAEYAKYLNFIDEDEQHRLFEFLGEDFSKFGFKGTYTTHPPQVCARCGKLTEFIDWVYTALARGVHTPEWFVETICDHKIRKKTEHDVYCSRCGHLTAFRDASGTEGPMAHISEANKYDHAAKSWNILKRDVAERAPGWASEFGWTYGDNSVAEPVAKRAPGWAAVFGWTHDDDSVVDPVAKHAPGWAAGFGWTHNDDSVVHAERANDLAPGRRA